MRAESRRQLVTSSSEDPLHLPATLPGVVSTLTSPSASCDEQRRFKTPGSVDGGWRETGQGKVNALKQAVEVGSRSRGRHFGLPLAGLLDVGALCFRSRHSARQRFKSRGDSP